MPLAREYDVEKERLARLAERLASCKDVNELADAVKSYVGWHGKESDPTQHLAKALAEYLESA